MASVLNTSTYGIKGDKAYKLFAESAVIDITSSDESESTEFTHFSVVNQNGRNAFELGFKVNNEAKLVKNPVFTFDETTNEFYLTYNNLKYFFVFYTQEKMSICTIKGLGL